MTPASQTRSSEAPACILWPDRDRQWEAAIPVLQADLPQLMILGDYAPDKRIGPAIWLRCVIAGNAPDVSLPKDGSRFFISQVSRQPAIIELPDHLKPLAEFNPGRDLVTNPMP